MNLDIKEVKKIVKNLNTISENYSVETKDLMARVIQLETQLIRLNQHLFLLRKMLRDIK